MAKLNLVPVDHDPFAGDPMSGELNSLHATIEGIRGQITDLNNKMAAFANIAEQIDKFLHSELTRLAGVADKVASEAAARVNTIHSDLKAGLDRVERQDSAAHFDAKLNQISKDLSALYSAISGIDKGVADKINTAIKKVGELIPQKDEPVAVNVVRDRTGKPVKITKGDQAYTIERRDGQISGMVPEGQEAAPKERRGAAKRFQ